MLAKTPVSLNRRYVNLQDYPAAPPSGVAGDGIATQGEGCSVAQSLLPVPDRNTRVPMPSLDAPAVARFWRYVAKADGCWLWVGSRNVRNGYGQFAFTANGRFRILTAHRIAYVLAHGAIPDGLSVLHHCDVPACVNPAHLFAGTHTDNMRDASAKGRLSVPRPTSRGRRRAPVEAA